MKAHNSSSVLHGAVFVAGSVNKVNTPILVDSGSAVTILRRDLWERGEKPGMQKLGKVSGPVVVANGDPLHIIGTSEADILFAGKTFKLRVLIADAVSQDCLLGAAFLATHRFIVDFDRRVLQPAGTTIAMIEAHAPDQPKSVCRVSIPVTTMIRPREEQLLWANIHPTDESKTQHAGVLQLKEGFQERYQLLVARVVAIPSDQKVPIRLANLSPSPVTLYRGVNVGQFCPLVSPGEYSGTTAYRELLPLSHQGSCEREHQVLTSTRSQEQK